MQALSSTRTGRLAPLLLLAACGGDPAAPWVEDGAALTATNGRSMNGRSMNGRSMNGTDLTGLYVASVALSPVVVGSKTVTDVALAASAFSSKAVKLSTKALKGSVWTATLTDGSQLPLTIASASALAAPNADLTGYAVTYPTSAGAQPLCGLEANGTPVLAVPVIGTWNLGQGVWGGGSYSAGTTTFTFACRHAAIAKCLELGYKPWLSVGGASLQDYWVTCTRVLRADYCGDGTSYTVDGTLIDLYDRLGIQTDAAASWPVEAAWNVYGAACITPGTIDRLSLLGIPTPSCFTLRQGVTTLINTYVDSACGSGGFTTSALVPTNIIDRYQAQ